MENNLSKPLSVRINKTDYDKIMLIRDETNDSVSSLLREFIYSKKDIIIKESKVSKEERKKSLFLLAKTSNNINQLALQINRANKMGLLSENNLLALLSKLEIISNELIKQSEGL